MFSREKNEKSLIWVLGAEQREVGGWEGTLEVEGAKVHGSFEVFNSGGGWTFLFGKTLQTAFGVVHDYKRDIIDIEAGGKRASLKNQHWEPWWTNFKPASSVGVRTVFTGVLSGHGKREKGGIGEHDKHRAGGDERGRGGGQVNCRKSERNTTETSMGRGGGGQGRCTVRVTNGGVLAT
ncbi:hypothetical protein K438DRAFT_1773078 [Mycena galopus ATCC 62051]|nr:hypothetical protein K438DRAFT_1773078 [Mycena galopus ATCC 62051]